MLPLFSKGVEDLVRKMLLGQSLALAIGSVQHAFLDTLSQASTTRSVLRNWDIWSFMVSRPLVSWLWASCRACVGDLTVDCPVRGRGVVQNARSCSIEMLRESREGSEGAVFGRAWAKSIFSLADRLGRKGLESLRLSLPDVDGTGGGGSLLAPAPASAIRALHDLARLIILCRMPSLGVHWPAGVSGWCLAVAGGLSNCLEAVGVLFGLDNGSCGRGFSDTGRALSKSLCLTDLFRSAILLVYLINDRCDS